MRMPLIITATAAVGFTMVLAGPVHAQRAKTIFVESLSFVQSGEAWTYGTDPISAALKKLDIAFPTVGTTCQAPALIESASHEAIASVLPGATIVAAVVDWLAQKAVSAAVDKIDEVLQNQLKKYNKTWSTSANGDLYGLLGSSNASFDPATRSALCFRYTRMVKTTSGNNTISKLDADFIGQILYEPRERSFAPNQKRPGMPEYITVRPLRIFYPSFDSIRAETTIVDSQHPEVKYKNIQINFSADVARIFGNKGESDAGVVSGGILTTRIKNTDVGPVAPVADKVIYQAFGEFGTGDKTGDKPVLLGVTAPLPPWSEGAERHNSFVASVTVVETGTPDPLLKLVADTFHKNKDSITKDLTGEVQKYAKSHLGASTPSSTN